MILHIAIIAIEVQRTTLYTCRACSTPLVDKSFVVYLRVPPTTSITILSDYENTSKTIKTALQNVMKSHEIKPGLSLTTTLRGDFKTAHPTPDSTYIFVTPVLERYIICDPEDPSTGFYREMSLLKTNQSKTRAHRSLNASMQLMPYSHCHCVL